MTGCSRSFLTQSLSEHANGLFVTDMPADQRTVEESPNGSANPSSNLTHIHTTRIGATLRPISSAR